MMATDTKANEILNSGKVVLSTAEAGELMGISTQTVRKLAKIPGFPKFTSGRKILIPRDAFIEWVNDYRN